MRRRRPNVALAARELSFTYPGGEFPALDRLSLQVRDGACTGLLGPNGAGKTTFVSLVANLLPLQHGELEVFGERSTSKSARRAIGFCPQELALYTSLTAAENLRFFGRLAGLSGARLQRRVDACLEIASLVEEADTRVERFSGGMKRRLNLASALVHEPRLLLLDEPTVGVDAQSRLAIFEALEALSAGGTTIVYTTHYMEEVERLCSEVAVVDNGCLIASGATSEVVASRGRPPVVRLVLAPKRATVEVATESREHGFAVRVIDSGELELRGNDLTELLEEVARLSAQGDVLEFETHRPTLEERFLELTGEGLRD